MFDFSKTAVATSANFITPGIYRLKPKGAKTDKTSGKNADYLEVTFVNEEGVELKEKFFLSEKALPRLQYLHNAWVGKPCDKTFKSISDLETYFNKIFSAAKVPTKPVIVGGQIVKDKVFAALPYSDFVVDEDSAELGEFEEGSALWKKYVTKSNQRSETEGTNNTILNTVADASGGAAASTEEAGDDLPW